MSNTKKVKNPLYGEIFKKLRKAKNFNLSEIEISGLSDAALSSFENGKSYLSMANFMQALQLINTSALEYEYAYNKSVPNSDQILYSLEAYEAYQSQNRLRVEAILKKMTELCQEFPSNKKYQMDKTGIEGLLQLMNPSYSVDKKGFSTLTSYLRQLDYWSHYELVLLGRTTTLFTNGDLLAFTQKIISVDQINYDLHYGEHARIQTLLNIATTLIYRDRFHDAKKCLDFLENGMKIREIHLFEKIGLKYTFALYEVKKSLFEKAKPDPQQFDIMARCQSDLEYHECFDMAAMMQTEIQELKALSDAIN